MPPCAWCSRSYVLEITRRLHRNPVPYMLAVAMAANLGSAGICSFRAPYLVRSL